jgi:hypothetical protein
VIGNDFHKNVVLCGIKSIDTHGRIVVSFYNSKRNISGGRVNQNLKWVKKNVERDDFTPLVYDVTVTLNIVRIIVNHSK